MLLGDGGGAKEEDFDRRGADRAGLCDIEDSMVGCEWDVEAWDVEAWEVEVSDVNTSAT